MNLLVSSILSAGKVARGEAGGDEVSKLLKVYKDILFPDLAVEREDAATRTHDILKKEYERGPMKVKSLNYSKKRKKRS